MVDFTDYTRVVEIELRRESYEFDLFGVFYNPDTREYWTGEDSGCSCPSPWDDNFVPDRDLKGPYTFTEALREMDKMAMEAPCKDTGWFVDQMMTQRAALIAHAKEAKTFPVYSSDGWN